MNILSFGKFIINEATMTKNEIIKRSYRPGKFAERFVDGGEFVLADGGNKFVAVKLIVGDETFTPKDNADHIVTALKNPKYKNIILVTKDGKQISSGKVLKDGGFGGKGSKESERFEYKNIDGINKFLKENGPIKIVLKNRTVDDVVLADKAGGKDRKADIVLKNSKGKEVIFISHKEGSKPRDFSQWGGISELAGSNIANHKEVKSFLDAIKEKYGDSAPEKLLVGRMIKSKELSMWSIYGPDWGPSAKPGIDNVDVVIQGDIMFEGSDDDGYKFVGNHLLENGDIPESSYAPMFVASYRSGRNSGGIKNCRIFIFPKEGKNIKEWL